MKKILVAGLLFFFLELLADDTVTTAPGEITVAINPQKIPNHPMAPAQYRKPTDYTPKLYKYNLKQISDIFSKDLIHKAQNQMRRIESVNKNGKWKPDGKSLDLHECPEWFKDAKFGIFVDWGLWSLASWAPKSRKGAMYPDWYELRMYSDFDSNSPFWGYRSYHVKNWGADFQRDHFIPLFQAKNFNPEKLVDLFKECGAKYVIPFSKHHSGFCLWPSSYTFRNSVEMGPKRDISGEIADSCRKNGLKFGFYFSLSEWEFPVLDKRGNLANCSWNKIIPYSADMEYKASGKIAVNDFVREYTIPQAVEFIDKYSPDILWYDADWSEKAAKLGSYEIAAYFYNVSEKPVAINDRYGLGEPEEIAGKFTKERPRQWLRTVRGDFYTDEYGDTSECINAENYHPWEACRGISQSYGNNWQDDENSVLSAKEFVALFADIVARGGNLLLLVNLDGQGSIPEIQMQRLKEIGKWLSLNGETIFATRPQAPYTKEGVSYTRSKDGSCAYAIISEPKSEIFLQLMPPKGAVLMLLESKSRVKWDYAKNIKGEPGIKVGLPKEAAASKLPVALSVKMK